jgi:ssDNA-binding Zn-finger/Zn-ribbon topoisomerase 1
MQRCEKCNHDAILFDGVNVADVDYYRCPVCGAVWAAPKMGRQSHSHFDDARRQQSPTSRLSSVKKRLSP